MNVITKTAVNASASHRYEYRFISCCGLGATIILRDHCIWGSCGASSQQQPERRGPRAAFVSYQVPASKTTPPVSSLCPPRSSSGGVWFLYRHTVGRALTAEYSQRSVPWCETCLTQVTTTVCDNVTSTDKIKIYY